MLQIEGKIKKMPCYQIYKSPEKTRVTHEEKMEYRTEVFEFSYWHNYFKFFTVVTFTNNPEDLQNV